jgi:hypothetical protein
MLVSSQERRPAADQWAMRLFGALVLFLGFLYFFGHAPLYGIVLVLLGGGGVLYALTKPSRPCPQCGKRVKVHRSDCGACAFDFRQIASTQKPV